MGKLKQSGFLVLILVVGAVLRFYKADVQSIWLDEVFSMIHSNPDKSFSEIYAFIKAYDPHPPLYYFLLHIFVKVFGYSTLNARLFSAVVGVAGIYYIYLLAKELSGKRVGLIAAALLCVNYFHIYYSQEVRMYTLLCVTTIISFYYLVKFIKSPSVKTACIYGFFASLMIYSQFFGLFTLMSQYVILLVFVLRPYNTTNLKFLGYSFAAGLTTLVLYIPAIPILRQTSKATSNWILPPTNEVFSNMFKEFFGLAEIVIWLAMLGGVLFFLKVGKTKLSKSNTINPEVDKDVFAYVIVFSWIAVTLAIPFALSYIKLPVIINRYFINIVPAVIIVVAIGLDTINNSLLKKAAVSIFILCSLTDLFFVKDYYNKITKSQYREVAQKIKERNIRGSKVITYWGWILPYFFEDTPQIRVHGAALDEFVGQMQNGSKPVEAFWYFDGNSRPYALNPGAEQYLTQNFVLKEEILLNDAWARYYVPVGIQNQVAVPDADAPVKPQLYTAGNYNLDIKTAQLPLKVQDGDPAYIKVQFNGREIGNFYLNKNATETIHIPFSLPADEKGVIQLIYADKRFEYTYSRYSSVYLGGIVKKP